MSAFAISDNIVRPFRLERTELRGRLVRLGATVDQVLTRHDYPEPVSRLLGELFVLAATLAGALKYKGTFSLQTRSNGPIRLMVADCTHEGTMRGYADFDAAKVAAADPSSARDLLGEGHLALTVDQDHLRTAYQGLVEPTGETLTECMQTYFRQSEQIRTGLKINVDQVPGVGGWRAGGLMIQCLPEQAERLASFDAEDDWRRTMLLMGTVTEAELVDPGLPPDRLLFHLFHEEGVRVFDPLTLRFGCRCTRERVEALLRSFPADELEDMKQDDGELVVTCQFCNAGYRFDDAELARLHARTSH
jgi:molecular chaperone Hsp33